jgi:hypothetical protein
MDDHLDAVLDLPGRAQRSVPDIVLVPQSREVGPAPVGGATNRIRDWFDAAAELM